MKRHFLLLLALLLVAIARAQSLSGVVKDSADRPLVLACVYLADCHIGTSTDSKGYFNITDIPAGRHDLVICYPGLKSIHETIDISSDQKRDFTMVENVIVMHELLVVPGGQTIQYYLLNQLVKNYKPLSSRVSSYHGYSTARFEAKTPLYVLPAKVQRLFSFMASLMGFGKICKCLINHPELSLEMQANVQYAKGKLKAGKQSVRSNPNHLTEDELKTFLKKNWGCDYNPYDDMYGRVKNYVKYLKKAIKKNPADKDNLLKYKGSYTEDGKTIYIIGNKRISLHIVDELWQMRRFVEADENTDFCEISPDRYLPICYRDKLSFDFSSASDEMKAKLDSLKAVDTTKLSERKLRKRNEQIHAFEGLMKDPHMRLKWSATYNYRDITY